MKKKHLKKKRKRPKQAAGKTRLKKADNKGLSLASAVAEAEKYAREGQVHLAAQAALRGLEAFPDSPEMLAAAGYVHEVAGSPRDARECHEAALKVDPYSRPALHHFVRFLIRQGAWGESAGYLERLMELEPRNHWIYLALGTACMRLGNYERARQLIEKSISLNRNDDRAWVNLGNTLRFMRKFKPAERALKKALEMKRDKDVLVGLSSLYTDMGHYDRGLRYAKEVLSFKDGLSADILKAAAYPFMKLGRYDEAELIYRKALEADPRHAESGFGLASVLLVTGRLGEGWPLYRSRFDVMQTWLDGPWPVWAGEDLRGRRLYISAEQGAGDSIHFARFIPALKDLGAEVIFSFQTSLGRLFRCLADVAELLPCDEIDLTRVRADFQTALLELPALLGINEISRIPVTGRYLEVSRKIVERWRFQIKEHDDALKVGLVWAGNPEHVNDHNRSIRLSMLAPLGRIPGLRLFSLQVGEASRQIEECCDKLDIVDLTSGIEDFADTAGIIENLDLVVSVDTATAHLAGALGKPVIILLPFSPDWRWFLDREDSPWYPTARLLRQPKPGRWEPVIDQLVDILGNWEKESLKQRQKPRKNQNISIQRKEKLYLALSKGENFGWGVCSKYLKREVPKFYPEVLIWDHENSESDDLCMVNGVVFHALTVPDFVPISKVWGKRNFGYAFFENELNEISLENAKKFEKVLGGSSWNEEKMRALGIENAGKLIQGIDPEIFYPIEEEKPDDMFVIFSGGKFELRKGQDLVLRAVKIMQEKYDDVVLVNAWYNMWPQLMELFENSKYIKYERRGKTWQDIMRNIYAINGLDAERIITLDIVENKKFRSIYRNTDIGLFPNRCEGGTNLVMMEYMACGKPVIASYTSGHKDVLEENHAILLRENTPLILEDANGNLTGDWEEPSLDEIVDRLEYAWNHRSEMKRIGKKAGEYMKNFTWQKTAEQLVKIIFGN